MATPKKEVQGFDLANLKPTSDTIDVELVHPVTEEPLGMTITVYATHSKEYKAVVHAQANARIKKMSKGKKVEWTADDVEEAGLTAVANTTKGWNLIFDGKPVPFSVDKAKEIYSDYYWIKTQVEEAQNDLSNFMKG